MSESESFGDIDPAVINEVTDALTEESIIGMYEGGSGEEERLGIVDKWFPQEDEWQGKTDINEYQAHALAVAKHLPEAFPEIEEYSDFIHDVINDYEMLLTSVDGAARNQQMNVLMAMFGAGMSDDMQAQSAMLRAIAGPQEGDEDG